MSETVLEARPKSIPLVIDGLNCASVTREQYLRTRQGWIDALNLTIVHPWDGFEKSMTSLASTLRFVEQNPDLCTIATSVAGIDAARAAGRIAIVMGAQNSMFVENDLNLLAVCQRLGMRIMQPTYMEQNKLGCGVVVQPDTGLTELGRQWVEQMNRLRMLIDLSHVGYRTAADVIAATSSPLIVSHGNALAVCNSPRNIPDAQIRGVADKGGVVGCTFFSPMLRHDQRPSIEDWATHVQHMLKLVGEEHVGFSSDLSEGGVYTSAEQWDKSFGPNGLYPSVTGGLGSWYTYEDRRPIGFQSLVSTPTLVDLLARRGVASRVIEKIMGGNWRRVYREVWGE
jgi:membrane dipeptidase